MSGNPTQIDVDAPTGQIFRQLIEQDRLNIDRLNNLEGLVGRINDQNRNSSGIKMDRVDRFIQEVRTSKIHADDMPDLNGVNGDHDRRYYRLSGNNIMNRLRLKPSTELTIASGVIRYTGAKHSIDTESNAAADDLDTINGGQAGDVIFLRAESSARIPTLKHGTGNIRTPSGKDLIINGVDDIKILLFDGTNWIVLNDNISTGAFRVGIGVNGGFRIEFNTSNGITTIANDNTVNGSIAILGKGSELVRIDALNKRVGINDNAPSYELDVNGKIRAQDQFILPSYTVAGVPSGVTGGMIFVTDETGGAVPAFFDGTNWRRVTDRAIVA